VSRMEPYDDLSNVYHLPEMWGKHRIFRDRLHAGEILAEMLQPFKDNPALVLGIPAGGVPIASIIANRLGLALDLAVVSKITLPWDTEAGYGAVAFDGTTRLNERLTNQLRLEEGTVREGVRKTKEKVMRRNAELRGKKSFPKLVDRTVILVDDGLASGFTMLVAVEALAKNGAQNILAAIPTGLLRSIETLSSRVEAIFCPNIRSGMVFAVADAYENWSDVSENEVTALLREAGHQGSRE